MHLSLIWLRKLQISYQEKHSNLCWSAQVQQKLKIKTIMPMDEVCYRNPIYWSHFTFTFFSLNQLLIQLSNFCKLFAAVHNAFFDVMPTTFEKQ